MISIAMATYNGEKYIQEQLDSILRQNITDWELIICDDCSKDATLCILQKYSSKDARIKIYKNEVNLGFSKNFEKAIKLCKGEYIALADQDDIWLPNHLEVLLNLTGSHDLAWSCALKMNANGVVTNDYVWNPGSFMHFVSINLLYYYIVRGNSFAGNSMLIRKSFLDKKNAFPIPSGVYHDEWLFFVSCFFNGMIWNNQAIITYRRCHDSNVTGIPLKSKNAFTYVLTHVKDARQRMRKAYRRLELLKEYRSRFNKESETKQLWDDVSAIMQPLYSWQLYKRFYGLKKFKKCYSDIYVNENSIKKKIQRYVAYIFGII